MKKDLIFCVVLVSVLALGLTISTQSIADDPHYPNGLPFQAIEQDFDAVIDAIDTLQSSLTGLQNELKVEVVVNTAACTSLPVQCANFGYVNPTVGNDSPVQLVATVSRGGVPVTGLEFVDFTFHTGVVAPGGALVLFCTESHQGDTTCGDPGDDDYFLEGGGGTYLMWLRPYNFEDWDDGLYVGNLSVADAEGSGVSQVSFLIE
jgi:hypothetical protein